MQTNLALFLALALSGAAQAATTDILNPPPMPTKGWEITSSSNIGQSFNAVASDVTLSVYVADQETYTQQSNQALLTSCTTSCTVTPWDPSLTVSSSISLNATVYEGEGVSGKIIYQSPTPITLDKPFNGIASVDLGKAGVFLTPGQQYTVVYTEISGSPHTYWQLFATIDSTPQINPATNQIDPNYNHGSYYGGWAYFNGVQQNPDSNIGDIAFQIIDNNPPYVPEACQGTSAIASSTGVSKLFMTLANGDKVAYSNAYGKPGTTTYTYNGNITAGTFPVGSIVTYVGIKDASTICVPNVITIDPAPVTPPPAPVTPSCIAPATLDVTTNSCVIPATPSPVKACDLIDDSKKVEGEGKITAVGTDSVTVGDTIVFFDECTVFGKEKKSFVIGQRVEFKGHKSGNTLIATKVKAEHSSKD